MTNPSVPKGDENKKLKELFLAVYFNDLEKVIDIKNHYPKIYNKKNNFPIDNWRTIDLRNLTHFNQTIWLDKDSRI